MLADSRKFERFGYGSLELSGEIERARACLDLLSDALPALDQECVEHGPLTREACYGINEAFWFLRRTLRFVEAQQ